MKLVLFSDLHLTVDAEVYGRSPLRCLQQAIDHVRVHHADADLCLLMGDLANQGREDEYRALETHLRSLPMRHSFMMGNHDDRANFRATFGTGGTDATNFVQQTIDIGNFRCVLLDTLEPGSSEGSLGEGRLQWLSSVLAAADRECLVFLHHPPVKTHLPAFDTIGLRERTALAAVLKEHKDTVAGMFFGHCHMSISGTIAGIPAFGMRSLVSQMLPNMADDRFLGAPELPPAYGLVMAENGELTVHVIEFGFDEPEAATQ